MLVYGSDIFLKKFCNEGLCEADGFVLKAALDACPPILGFGSTLL
jgi:hypothetical protein